jgi:3-deoxy-D-manno-octulosonic-acid transferase
MFLFLIYQFVFLLVFIITLPYLFKKGIVGKRGFAERLGYYDIAQSEQKTIWFHAASMGELKAISALVPLLKQKYPEARIVISTVTQTGKCRAQKLGLDAEVFYWPLDFRPAVANAIARVKPSMFIVVETELWPMLIYEMRKNDIKVLVINGRLTERSFKYYKPFKFFFKVVLEKIDFVMAQTSEDAARFIELGMPIDKVEVLGNIKFDQLANVEPKTPAVELLPFINQNGKFVFIAGSVRDKEIPIIIEAIKNAKTKVPKLKTIIAPRHMKYLKALENSLFKSGMKFVKRSKLNIANSTKYDRTDILVLDSMGELGDLYSYAHLAFVGGSLVPIGGHDPLEPASASCAVCFGPHMENSRHFAALLIDSGGAVEVGDSQGLASLIIKLANDSQMAKTMGQKARKLVLDNSGVSDKTVKKLIEYL